MIYSMLKSKFKVTFAQITQKNELAIYAKLLESTKSVNRMR